MRILCWVVIGGSHLVLGVLNQKKKKKWSNTCQECEILFHKLANLLLLSAIWLENKLRAEATHPAALQSPRYCDPKTNWASQFHIDAGCKKAHLRMDFNCNLCSSNVDTAFRKMFYSCFIKSVLTFSYISWHGWLSIERENRLLCIVKVCCEIGGISLSWLIQASVPCGVNLCCYHQEMTQIQTASVQNKQTSSEAHLFLLLSSFKWHSVTVYYVSDAAFVLFKTVYYCWPQMRLPPWGIIINKCMHSICMWSGVVVVRLGWLPPFPVLSRLSASTHQHAGAAEMKFQSNKLMCF